MMDEHDRLLALLERAQRRVDSAIPFSPEWDAATDEIEELERRLEALPNAVEAIQLTA